MKYLTKSRFKTALDCPRKLYYANNSEYGNSKENDEFLQALAEGGYQVGELAKLYYPNGHDITESGYDIPLKKTYELLKQENVVIYEAAIRYENLFIRIDVLEKQGNHVKLIEVKAKSFSGMHEDAFTNKKGFIESGWKPYLYDVAFQKFVLEKAFPSFQIDCYLMLADKSKAATINGLNQKFQLVTDNKGRTSVKLLGNTSLVNISEPILSAVKVNHLVESIYSGTDSKELSDISFEDRIGQYANAYENDLKLYNPIGTHCGSCEFNTKEKDKRSGFMECWQEQTSLNESDFSKPLIFELWNFRGKQKCIEEGIIHLSEVEKEHIGEIKPKENGKLSNRERQWMQVEKEKNNDNSVYIDYDGLKAELKNHKFPLHFIDFETSMVAIPFYKDSVPYEQIAFQYSHHIMAKDGTVKHASQFLSTEKGAFPNFEFIRSLKKDLENDNGTIFRFAEHENTVLNQIKQQLIEKTDIEVIDRVELIYFIDSITHKTSEGRCGERDMIDMCQIVKDYYYDPYTKGSNSIKAVLPAVLKRSKFIQNRYSKPIYGKGCNIPSLNFNEPQIWIQKDDEDNILSPYKLLPPLFNDVPMEEVEQFITDENIAGGGAALTAYAKMQFTEISETERNLVAQGLLRYCELDTLAMVIIYEYWLNEISREN